MDLGLWQTILTGALALATIAAALFAGLKIGTERTLRASNTDLRARVADLEAERDAGKTSLAEIRGKVATVSAENKLLRSMMQGRVEWNAISDQIVHLAQQVVAALAVLTEHHEQAVEWWEKADGHLKAIETGLNGRNS